MQAAFPVLAGLILGSFSRYSSSFPDALRWLGNFGAPWLAAAFFVARPQRSRGAAAVAGAVTLSIATLAHYVPYRIARDGFGLEVAAHPVLLWVVVGTVFGAIFGLLGWVHACHRRSSLLAAGCLAASFAGEAIVLFYVAHPNAVEVAVPIEAAIAMALPVVLTEGWRDRAKTYVATALLALPAIAILAATMGAIRRVYPGL